MKTNVWAKTILTSYRYLDRIANVLDEMIERKGLNSYNVSGINYSNNNIFTLAEKLIDLSERKVTLINLKVLTEKALAKCGEKSAVLLIEKYIDCRKNEDIAERNSLSYRTFFRRLTLAEEKFESVLENLGFSDEDLEIFLEKEAWIGEIKRRQSGLRKGENFVFEKPALDRLAVS